MSTAEQLAAEVKRLADEIDNHFGEEGWGFPRLKRIAADMRALAAKAAEPGERQRLILRCDVMHYDVLSAYADAHKLSYNELCRIVRDAVGAESGAAEPKAQAQAGGVDEHLREVLQLAVSEVGDWLRKNCVAEPPRTHIALLQSFANAELTPAPEVRAPIGFISDDQIDAVVPWGRVRPGFYNYANYTRNDLYAAVRAVVAAYYPAHAQRDESMDFEVRGMTGAELDEALRKTVAALASPPPPPPEAQPEQPSCDGDWSSPTPAQAFSEKFVERPSSHRELGDRVKRLGRQYAIELSQAADQFPKAAKDLYSTYLAFCEAVDELASPPSAPTPAVQEQADAKAVDELKSIVLRAARHTLLNDKTNAVHVRLVSDLARLVEHDEALFPYAPLEELRGLHGLSPRATYQGAIDVYMTDNKPQEIARWNFDATDEELLVCRNEHAKGAGCSLDALHPVDALKIINALRGEVLRLATQPAGTALPDPNAPAEVYLQLYGALSADEGPVNYEAEDVSWHWHRVHDSDVRYVQAALQAQPEVQALLQECANLLKKAPKVTRDMYVGSDRVAWGRQAQDLARRVDEAMRAPQTKAQEGSAAEAGTTRPSPGAVAFDGEVK